MKHILAVYDVDPVYAARFAEVVNQKEKIPFEVVAFSSIERLRAFAAEEKEPIRAEKVILLSGESRLVRQFPVSTNTSPVMRLCAT